MFQPRPLTSGRCHRDISVSPVSTVIFSIITTASARTRVPMTLLLSGPTESLQPGLLGVGTAGTGLQGRARVGARGTTPQQKLKGGPLVKS